LSYDEIGVVFGQHIEKRYILEREDPKGISRKSPAPAGLFWFQDLVSDSIPAEKMPHRDIIARSTFLSKSIAGK